MCQHMLCKLLIREGPVAGQRLHAPAWFDHITSHDNAANVCIFIAHLLIDIRMAASAAIPMLKSGMLEAK